MSGLLMTARLAGTAVAIPSLEVESVVRVGELIPVPRCPPSVLGLFALRSRVLTLVDPARALRGDGEGGPTPATRQAIVLNGGGDGYALLVDQVEDVVEHDGSLAAATRLGQGWDAIAAGIVDLPGERRILISIGAILSRLHDQRAAA